MKLPQFIADKISNYVDAEDDSHRQACHDAGQDPHDIDPINELPWTLENCFPEFMKADGIHTGRTIEWGELHATLWGPAHKGLKLCKIGWHRWTMLYRGKPYYTQCGSCTKRSSTYIPRWAR